MKPLSFVIVGSGWRSLFFARAAQKYPELFELKYMLCRTQEKADKMSREYGVPTTTSAEVCEQSKPDFVVLAINRVDLVAETRKWTSKGFPVLSETPLGNNLEELKEVWEMVQNGAKIQVAEQYHRYPIMAAGLKAIAENKLSDPFAVHIALCHDYHAASLIRRMLQPHNPMDLKLESVCGKAYKFQVTETDSREGAITDGSVKDRGRSMLTLEFNNNKFALYDFAGVQYHSFIRSRHLNVRGRDGEWNDTMLRYVGADYLPVEEKLTAYLDPKYAVFENEALLKQSKEWKPGIMMEKEQDEYAVETMMYDMRAYIEGGEEVYPMAEALEDAYWCLLFRQAEKTPGCKIIPEKMPWQ